MICGASETKVLEALASGLSLSQGTIRAVTGLSGRSIRYALETLKSAGAVQETFDLSDSRRKKYKIKEVRK